MGVYEDMANGAGYAYGTDENAQMAQMIEHQREQNEEAQQINYDIHKVEH